MLKHRTSIYCRMRVPQRPTYRKTTLLDLMRAERKRDELKEAVDRINFDALVFGTGFGLTHIPRATVLGNS